MVRARKYWEEHEIGSFPVKLLISCHYSFYTVASETSDIASNEDSYCKTPVTLSDINTTSLLKAEYYLCEGILLAVCWDCRCSSKATLGTMFSAPFTAPVQLAATPDPPTQRRAVPCSERSGTASPAWAAWQRLWIALAMLVSHWSPCCSRWVLWERGWARHWHQWEVLSVGSGHWLALLNLGRQTQLSLGSAEGQLCF